MDRREPATLLFLFALLLPALSSHELGAADPGRGESPAAGPPAADSVRLPSLEVLALAPVEGRAVVQLADERLRVVSAGDLLPAAVRVVEVLPDRLVLEQAVAGADPRRLWVYEPERPGAASRVEVLESDLPRPLIPEKKKLPPEPPSEEGVRAVSRASGDGR